VLGAECAGRVVCNVRWWLCRRYPDELEDFVQDVYVKLVAESGLGTFAPPPGSGAEAFRGWLYGVVRNYALCTIRRRKLRAHIALAKTEMLPEPTDGSQAFARRCIVDMVGAAVETVKNRWSAKAEGWHERFDVFLQFVQEKDSDYERARARLGISYENAKKLRHDLKEEICLEVRAQVRDGLLLEPGLDSETIERMIDHEIRALFDEAFPDNCVWDLFFPEPNHESDPETKP